MAFTKEQMEAINSEGENIIVSAGAGSGKTAVLTERVIRKLKDGVSVDRLLVLTFTNEAASEMKSRIRTAIIKNNLNSQLDLLESSYITTFDSYALSLVKKYHYILNINKNIGIIQDGIITIKKYEIINKIFEDKYLDNNFTKLIDEYCKKDDFELKKFIISVSNQLDLLTNKEEYLDKYIDNYYNDNYINTLINSYLLLIKEEINDLRDIYNNFINYASDSLINKIDEWLKPLFSGNNYLEYSLIKTSKDVRFVGVDEGGISLKEELKDKVNNIKHLLRYKDVNEIKEILLKSKDYSKIIIDIVREIDNYINSYKDKIGMYEFNDISHMAITIVKENITIREELKEYFNEIMVDEYQDTSDIQEEFLSYIGNNNIYMVGDIKQSIYRFRNANPYIFGMKYDNYSKGINGKKIDLLKNFRSRKETLYNINEIFNLVMDNDIGNANYLESHNMVYGNTLYDNEDSGHSNYMELYNYHMEDNDIYSKEEKEIFIIAEDIIDKINNKYQVFDKETSKLRDLKYSDICIITDRNKYLDLYKKILEYKGIPTQLYMDLELNYDNVFLVMKNLINLVNHVKNNNYDTNFKYVYTSIARSFIFRYDDNYIYENIKNNTYYKDDIVILAKDIDINLSLGGIINKIINKYNIYDKLTVLPDIDNNIIRINNLLDIANTLNDMGYSLTKFIDYLDNMFDLDLSVKYSANTSSGDAVKIMNIHKSKGLEFSLCYFTGMHNKFTIKEVSSKFIISNKYGLILPYQVDGELENSIIKDMYTYDYFKEEISEKIRLFYVALTRAREKMIILTNIDSLDNCYNRLVPNNVRLKYRSFLDILKSIKITNKYLVDKEGTYSKDYLKTKIKDITMNKSDKVITNKSLEIDYDLNLVKHYSKEMLEIIDMDTAKNLEYGTKLHMIMEYDNFNNPESIYVRNLLKQIPDDFINVYHEYEFKDTIDNINYHGIIDLMVEYNQMIYIIDYKTKVINDKLYKEQVDGYKRYIEKITNKEVKTYLYSIIDNTLMEV